MYPESAAALLGAEPERGRAPGWANRGRCTGLTPRVSFTGGVRPDARGPPPGRGSSSASDDRFRSFCLGSLCLGAVQVGVGGVRLDRIRLGLRSTTANDVEPDATEDREGEHAHSDR